MGAMMASPDAAVVRRVGEIACTREQGVVWLSVRPAWLARRRFSSASCNSSSSRRSTRLKRTRTRERWKFSARLQSRSVGQELQVLKVRDTAVGTPVVLIGFHDQGNVGIGYLTATLASRGHAVEIVEFRQARAGGRTA